jgi:competence protein ComFC
MPNTQNYTEARPDMTGFLLFKRRLWTIGNAAADLIFPPRCAGCGRVDETWCSRCQQALEALPVVLSVRDSNGIPIASTGEHIDQLQRAVHAFKYNNVTELETPLGDRLVADLSQLSWPEMDVIVPVPLHPGRQALRGYNQAQLLADAISQTIATPCTPTAIQRTRDTRSQVGLNPTERQKNMHQAFYAEGALVTGKTILLIDDVCTTGATLEACAQAALAAGARAVFGLTVTTA